MIKKKHLNFMIESKYLFMCSFQEVIEFEFKLCSIYVMEKQTEMHRLVD